MILSQPYPCYEVKWKNLWICLFSGLFVMFFLLFFQPFGISNWKTTGRFWKITGYGLVTFVVLAFDFFVIKKNLKSVFKEEDWQVWKEIFWNLFILLSISFGNYFYNWLIFSYENAMRDDFFMVLLVTFSVGIFPVSALVFINYTLLLRKYSQPVAVKDLPPIDEKLLLTAENGKDRFSVFVDDLLFIESSDNYATVCFINEERLKKELLRSSLSRLETQITDKAVVRCHRSYIVNLGKVSAVSGNAQGYKLHFRETEQQIPVARKYASEIIGYFKKNI